VHFGRTVWLENGSEGARALRDFFGGLRRPLSRSYFCEVTREMKVRPSSKEIFSREMGFHPWRGGGRRSHEARSKVR